MEIGTRSEPSHARTILAKSRIALRFVPNQVHRTGPWLFFHSNAPTLNTMRLPTAKPSLGARKLKRFSKTKPTPFQADPLAKGWGVGRKFIHYTKTAATWCIAMSLQLDSQDNEQCIGQGPMHNAKWPAGQCR